MTSKHSNHNKQQQCTGFYEFYKESGMYMSPNKVLLERLKTKPKVDFSVHFIFYYFVIIVSSVFGSVLDAQFIPN